MTFTHYAFSDDSSHQEGRFNSLALISLKESDFDGINKKLEQIFNESGVKNEFKWEKLKNAKYKFTAEKMIDFVFNSGDKIRIDVLIWDMEDSRHKGVHGRNDNENLVRMYYHLVATTLSKRWPIKTYWHWIPDKQSSVDWKTLQDCISNKKHKCTQDLFGENSDFEKISLEKINPDCSKKHILIQLADLFAGLGAYSYGHFGRFTLWESENKHQASLFPVETAHFSEGEKYKFHIINILNKKCKDHHLQISFNSSQGFKSNNQSSFINFWLYSPQTSLDKAPIRK